MPHKDPIKRKEYQQEYYKKHKQKFLKRAKRWVKNNPEKRKEVWRRYNKKKSVKLYKIKWHENKYFNGKATKLSSTCVMCGTTKNLIIHHRDGCNGKNGKTLNNNPDNLVILCKSCHPKVHNRWGVKEVGDV